MKWMGCILVVFLAGCQATTQPGVKANISGGPERSLVTTPLVECVGDDICAGLVATVNAQGNSLWRCDDCALQATSGVVLQGLPLALAQHPDVVMVITGSYDVDDPAWTAACNSTSPDPNKHTCANIMAIVNQLEAAKIPFILGSTPAWQDGTMSDELAAQGVTLVDSNVFDFERDEEFIVEVDPPGNQLDTGAVFVDFYHALTAGYISPNGIDPDQDGYSLMISMTQPVIEAYHVGGTK